MLIIWVITFVRERVGNSTWNRRETRYRGRGKNINFADCWKWVCWKWFVGNVFVWMTLLISGWIRIIIESKLVGRLKGRGFWRVDGEDMMVAGKTAVIDSWKNMMVAGQICWRQGHVGGWAKWPANSEIRVGGWLMWECFKGHCKKVVNIQRLEIDENVVLLVELVVTVVEVVSF